jgi:BspA type Leucine rich repeat region (6 copies)
MSVFIYCSNRQVLGDATFLNCEFLSSVTMGNSIISIGLSAFEFTALTSIIIPDSVLTIGKEAFRACASLSTVIMGNNVQEIGAFAFQFAALTSITLPASITSIAINAFEPEVIINQLTYQPTTVKV